MRAAKILRCVVCFFCITWTQGLLFQEDNGHCIWYGQCGFDAQTRRHVNCAYNGTAKPLTNPKALELYREYCPDLYQGPNTKTCCSDMQILTLVRNIDVPRQALGGCPSCLHNFLNVYCYLTCAPYQSKFVYPKRYSQFNATHKQVNEVDYSVTHDFAVGMYNSCRDVRLPSANERAIGILCGHPVDKCTPENWLEYMGNTQNQQTPFQINFNFTDKPFVNPAGIPMNPLNANMIPCYRGTFNATCGCLCQDCRDACSPGDPAQMLSRPVRLAHLEKHYFDTEFVPVYRMEQLIIKRTGHHPDVVHNYPPPSVEKLNFTPIFEKEFLHQVLDLQLQVQNLRVPYGEGNTTIGLEDICFQPSLPNNMNCMVLSMLNYWQNNGTKMDRVILDRYGFFVLADYLDHFLHCVRYPGSFNDTTALHDSCLGLYNGPVFPWTVLDGYDGVNYQNATALVITFVVNNYHDKTLNAKAEAWEKVFIEFMKNYTAHQPNMSIAVSTGGNVEATDLVDGMDSYKLLKRLEELKYELYLLNGIRALGPPYISRKICALRKAIGQLIIIIEKNNEEDSRHFYETRRQHAEDLGHQKTKVFIDHHENLYENVPTSRGTRIQSKFMSSKDKLWKTFINL